MLLHFTLNFLVGYQKHHQLHIVKQVDIAVERINKVESFKTRMILDV